MKSLLKTAFLALTAAVLFAGCFEVPLTDKPTQKVDPRLIGTWAKSGDATKIIIINAWDSENYVIYSDGLYKAFHSHIGKNQFLTIESLSTSTSDKFNYMAWSLSEDGKRLTAKTVASSLFPKKLRSANEARKIVEENMGRIELYNDETITLVKQ